jgi:tRNA 2-thiouridine synthesizing protein A
MQEENKGDGSRTVSESKTTPPHDAAWDAGDLGCGDLVLELRRRLRAMKAGEVLRLTVTGTGAPEDLLAWCRLTGHVLICSWHPNYWIRRKED